MPNKMTFQRNLIALEDLLLGEGTVSQIRGVTPVTVSKINASNFPYSTEFTIKEKIDSLDSVHYVDSDNLPVYIATPSDDGDLNLNSVLWVKNISPTERHLYYYDQLILKWKGEDGDLLLDTGVFDDAVATITAAYEAADAVVTAAYEAAIADEVTARSDADTQIEVDYTNAINAALAGLDLGSASRLDVGTDPFNVIQATDDGKLPVIDGSNLTNLPVATIPAGCTVQKVMDENNAVTSYSALIPRAGSAPAATAGTEIHSIVYTPKATGNEIHIRFEGCAHPSDINVGAAALLFNGSTFLKGSYARSANASSNYPFSLSVETTIIAASTAPITISVRAGPVIADGNIKFNDNSWGIDGKGSSLVIEETKV